MPLKQIRGDLNVEGDITQYGKRVRGGGFVIDLAYMDGATGTVYGIDYLGREIEFTEETDFATEQGIDGIVAIGSNALILDLWYGSVLKCDNTQFNYYNDDEGSVIQKPSVWYVLLSDCTFGVSVESN